MMVCIVLIGMYICCNVLNYSINSYDSRDVHIVLEDRKIRMFLIKENVGVVNLVRVWLFFIIV